MISLRSRVGRRIGSRIAIGSAWLVLAASPISALAQGFGPDPFRPFNSQYDSYVYPIAPGPLDPVGNPSLNSGIRGANQFSNYLNSVNGGNVGTRFDQLYRDQMSGRRRAFTPAREADARFEEQQTAAADLYFKYLRERDPAKRAALLKDYNAARKEATRDLSAGSRAATGRKTEKPRGAAAAGEDDPAMEDDADDAAERTVISPRRSGTAGAGVRGRTRGATPPPPPISGAAAPTSSSRSNRDRKPSDVLDRAVRSEREGPRLPGRPRASRNVPPPPPITP
jgi:hypothetical protein